MARAPARASSTVRLFDAHCHLQDPCVFAVVPSLIRAAAASGVCRSVVLKAVNLIGSIVLHDMLMNFVLLPLRTVKKIGLDNGSDGKTIDFGEQVKVFQRQLELATEFNEPVSVHCVLHASSDYFSLQINVGYYILVASRQTGPFPAGVLLHSYLGSAEMRHALDALPKLDDTSLLAVPTPTTSNESLDHPSDIHIARFFAIYYFTLFGVMKYVASLLEMPETEVQNLLRSFTRMRPSCFLITDPKFTLSGNSLIG
ncbi:hypothetical protein ABZP36_006965 [Zizania latifolia]